MHIGSALKWARPWKDRRWLARVLALTGGAFFLGFVVLGFITVRIWETTNSVDFCTQTCHDIHPEEPRAYQLSYHARVQCTECHMGRVSTSRAMALKAGHAWHLPATLLGF